MSDEYHDDSGFDDFVGSDTGGTFGGARLLKFVSDRFATREGETIDQIRQLAAVAVEKRLQKFVGKKLIETIIIPSGKHGPDLEELNEKAPREEWGTDLNGQPRGPWSRLLLLKLIELSQLNRFAFITSTIGGGIAIGDLADKVKVVRQFRGPGVIPIVSLGVTTFRNRHGGVTNRPDFKIHKWIRLAGAEAVTAAPAPQLPANSNQSATETARVVNESPMTTAPLSTTAIETVTVPSLAEEMGDSLPF
jgi:hypothetical protein